MAYQEHNTNKNRATDTLDLHEQKTTEAIDILKARIAHLQQQGFTCMRIITGKGLNSPGGMPFIKPRVLEFFKEQNLGAWVDPSNTGCVTVSFPTGMMGFAPVPAPMYFQQPLQAPYWSFGAMFAGYQTAC